ncbi:MAG TPA: S26 family signal peptidase, partial [Rhizomicrobium sp.]
IYNASASAPTGFYAVRPKSPLFRGELVLATAPFWARTLAAERGYLPLEVPVVKRIAALSGDVVCADASSISINGTVKVFRLKSDRKGRALPNWIGCKRLGPDDVFLLMPHPESFDGRYFGVISASQISGRLVALWTR